MKKKPTLTLIRGIPGSGKSTAAKRIDAHHFEADMFFVTEQGEYQFDPLKLKQAHAWCFEQTQLALQQGEDVVVSNTFVRRWEIMPYFRLAKQLNVTFQVRVCSGEFGSIHGVEPATINNMKARWQTWQNERQL
ncbi:ATP-binding protein [Vibrio sp. LaRot3]|uniref:ATP-binding protein n=1 Tax=Vibrio sp. LaRot3 TaxID=2998829 RepID=UPI0022CDC7E3|nr:ATP-binding protein [Vibrio sp. LaRot3]MDA0147479.1 ATP-binding protein [Vibrio sp. LaRot3]